ncbi:hypothetical protein SEA_REDWATTLEHOG_61 [Gordonia phage RedWattleHog]|nr:hypothetical protein SEA_REDWATTLEHOG_61 [Gordonia phage RedWattleHog]
MGRIGPRNATILWCDVCQSQTTHDNTDPDHPTCHVCSIKLMAQTKEVGDG